jgi:serpin B
MAAIPLGATHAYRAGCSVAPMIRSELPREEHPALTPSESAELAAGNVQFALEAYRELAVEHPAQNLVWSPYSASVALAMAYAGAGGRTAREMASVMHWTLPSRTLHAAFDALDHVLAARTRGAVALHLADSLWGLPSLRFEQPFLDTLARDYGTGVRLTDFVGEPDRSRWRINAWVADSTHGAIDELLRSDEFPPDTAVVLVQAVSLRADWATRFDTALSWEEPFFLLDGKPTKATTMHGWHLRAPRLSSDALDAVELPYEGGHLVLDVVVPKSPLGAFESGLTSAKLDTILGSLREGPLRISLPRFRFTGDTLSLADPLERLGMRQAFDANEADFSPMATKPQGRIYLSRVLQQGNVTVDEKGTEATAATTAVLGGTSAAPPSDDDIVISIDHPFLFVVRDLPTGTILFMGRVVDPSR